jgi:peptidoglycan/LPS O-acetylase OafA/YrhL
VIAGPAPIIYFREMMLHQPHVPAQAVATPVRVVALDRARSFITLLVVLYHSVLDFTWFGDGGQERWLGFDLVALFNDSFFMACMFFLSGLFVHNNLARRGPAGYLKRRGWRLGVPYLVSIFVVVPISYYADFLRYHSPGTADFNFFHYWWQMLAVGPWPSGASWFLWVLLALDAIAILLWVAARGAIDGMGRAIDALRDRPVAAFIAFAAFSVVIYLPLCLRFDASSWLVPGHYPLPIQTSRIGLYAGYFFTGVGVGAAGLQAGMLAADGQPAQRWRLWVTLALMFYGAILLLVYAHHNWISNFASPPPWWQTAYALAFALFSAAMTFTVPATFLRFAGSRFRLLDAMQPSAYGIYLVHFMPLMWLQYAVLAPAIPAVIKFLIVFTGTLSASWALTVLLRKIPAVARMI